LVGSIYRDRAYLSTSVGQQGPAFGGDTAFIIRVNEGTKGAFVQPVSAFTHEREFLMGHGQSLYVHKVRKFDRSNPANPESKWSNGGYTWVVEAEVVSEDWAKQAGVKIWESNVGDWAK
jgi:hypothetical protein